MPSSTPAPVRVVVADDHPVVRAGIRDMLEGADDITVVGEATNGAEALDLVQEEHPDVLLLDMEMPELSGVEVARRLQAESHPVRLLALSSYEEQEYVQGLLQNGASGYLTKEHAPELILEAVRAVARGEVRWFVQPNASEPSPPSSDLTPRETDILRLMAKGHSNTSIAEELSLAESTIRKHATQIYRKINAESAREAIAWAWQNGIMSREGETDTSTD
jgi:DNA-binding NarL/FixJ family response regulator